MSGSRLQWETILDRAAAIVTSYDTPVTLRQLFYRLIAAGIIPNTTSAYKTLSNRTAKARREGWFPALADNTREITRHLCFDGPDEALHWLASPSVYRRDRTEGQVHNIYIGVEKRTMLAQLDAWFGNLGIPVVALGGYSSQTIEAELAEAIERDGRPVVLLYAGDFDPSGEDILRNLLEKVPCFDQMVHVALTPQQVDEYNLPQGPGKRADSRAAGFVRRHGVLVQVELEALEPETVRDLYSAALDPYWDKSAFEAIIAAEEYDRRKLQGESA